MNDLELEEKLLLPEAHKDVQGRTQPGAAVTGFFSLHKKRIQEQDSCNKAQEIYFKQKYTLERKVQVNSRESN